jgi:hypothetical protein
MQQFYNIYWYWSTWKAESDGSWRKGKWTEYPTNGSTGQREKALSR